MAAPAIPQNVYVQQGDARAYISWSLVAGATSYDVARSTDNVNFVVVGSPTSTDYMDTSVTINTQYWYKVRATNSDGSSPYGTSQSVIPTLPGQLSLGELRLRAQQRSDRVKSNFVTVPEWNFFINQAYYELYDILIDCYEDYYVAPRLQFQTTGAQMYDLPNGQNYSAAPAFYKAFGLDMGLSNATNAWVTLKKFNFIERNRYVFPQLTSTYLGVFNMQYRIVGSQIMFIPTPSTGQYIGLWYFPRLVTLLRDSDVMDGISGWDQYVIVRAAKYALDKEESDTQKLDQELLYLKQRIEGGAQNRDAGQPDTISNTRSWGMRWGAMGYDGPTGGW